MVREIRLLHTSDLHLDASFRATGVPSARARERCAAHLEAFDQFLATARQVDAHVLLLAGDVFEAAHTRPQTVRHVAKGLAAWGRPAFVAPGNHDPIHSGSVYGLADWPPNVTLFTGAWSARHLPDLDLVVHGRGFTEPEEHARLVEGLDLSGPGTHVVVAHGSDESCRPDRHHPYRPFHPEELDALPAAYVALGHYHSFALLRTRRLTAAYSGCPIPQGFADAGEHGVVLARLHEAGVHVELLPLPARRFVTLDIDVSGLDTPAELAARVRAELESRRLEADFVRLALCGSLTPDLELDLAALRDEVAAFAHDVELADRTVPEYDLAALAQEATLRGHFVRTLAARLEAAPETDREVVQRALYFGLDALAGRPQPR